MKLPLPSLSRLLALMVASSAALLHAAADYSTPYSFTTFAGISSIGNRDGSGATARFYSPQDVATDSAGNAYIADEGNHTIRKITPAGVVSTFAGTFGEAGSADGTGTAAKFDSPQGLAIDATGNLYVADTGNHTIRKITPAGVVTTFAGLARVSGNTNATGGAARFNRPRKLAVDTAGNIYVTEAGNDGVRKITTAGVVSTFASSSSTVSLRFPEAEDIQARMPLSYGAITTDAAGNVYVSAYLTQSEHSQMTDTGYYPTYYYYGAVYQITPAGAVTRLWEPSAWRTYFGQTDNGCVSALAFNTAGQLICAQGYRLQRYVPQSDGTATFVTLAGDGTIGSADGAATSAKFGFPLALAYDRNSNLLIADTGNNIVRKLSAANDVTTVAGLALERATGTTDGAGDAARFVNPTGTVVDAAGNVYVADTPAHVIRKITPSGTVTTLAGMPGRSGYDDGVGTAARFNGPRALALGPDGALYVTDTNNHTIRRVGLDGTTTTFAGEATATGWYGGPRVTARFMFPYGLCFDSAGNLYVTSAATVRKIAPDGQVTTLAGLNSETGYVDGTGVAARFTVPYGITADSAGNLYVTEAPSSPGIARIRKVTPAGVVTTLAGAEQGYADGAPGTARFNIPLAITCDPNNNLFVADYANQVIRRIAANGAVSTIAGLFDAAGHADGVGRDARFFSPQGIAIDTTGALYVASGTTVHKGVLAAGPTITTQPTSQTVNAGTNVTFTVAANGTPTPTYQWYFNGAAISGATGASLSLSSVSATNAGDYTVVVTNGAGSVTSNKATLTVNTPTTPPPAGGGSSGGGASGGGGGAPSDWFAAGVTGALLLRAWLQRRR